jgi:hypothetical protein
MNKKLIWIVAAVAAYWIFFRQTATAAPVPPASLRETEKPGKGPAGFTGQMAAPKVGIALDRVTRSTAGA